MTVKVYPSSKIEVAINGIPLVDDASFFEVASERARFTYDACWHEGDLADAREHRRHETAERARCARLGLPRATRLPR